MSSGSDPRADQTGAPGPLPAHAPALASTSSSSSSQSPPPFITLHSRTGDSAPAPPPTTAGSGRDMDHAYRHGQSGFNPDAPHQHLYNNHGVDGVGPYHGFFHPAGPQAMGGFGYHCPPPPMPPYAPCGSAPDMAPKSITHDISRARYHIRDIGQFSNTLEQSAKRAFPNRDRPSRRYSKVHAILIRWEDDDLDVDSELQDLQNCFQRDYRFETERFHIPSGNSHLELMLRIGQLIKAHEAPDTLLIVYYGGHAKIDEARQSTWVATRQRGSPSLQWSAIQTLLERSASDVLLLLDCCSGAASATFPTGSSITEAICASSWAAFAPEPGLHSFTNILIEVLQEWRHRTFSVAMLHAEILARLKHPRPTIIQGRLSESRTTPVHFMMTANHKAPSIEIARQSQPIQPQPIQPQPIVQTWTNPSGGRSSLGSRPGSGSSGSSSQAATLSAAGTSVGSEPDHPVSGPDEDTPHVMISLALEEDQALDVTAWTQWLSAFPALAKYVKVQGVFKSHSTLVLLSMPVMIWDLLPEDHATSFVAFIRSNNLAMNEKLHSALADVCAAVTEKEVVPISDLAGIPGAPSSRPAPDHSSFQSRGTTLVGSDNMSLVGANKARARAMAQAQAQAQDQDQDPAAFVGYLPKKNKNNGKGKDKDPETQLRYRMRRGHKGESTSPSTLLGRQREGHGGPETEKPITNRVIPNQLRSAQWSRLDPAEGIPECPEFAPHVERRLEVYFRSNQYPNNNQREYLASNLGIEPHHVELWYHHRQEREKKALESGDGPEAEPVLVSANSLNKILEMLPKEFTLVLDVRSDSSRQQQWIDGSIHFRAPADFIERATLDQLELAFLNQADLDRFATWRQVCCIVFCADHLEFPWECPSAQALLTKLRAADWGGRCLILAGRFASFVKLFPAHVQPNRHSKHHGSVDKASGKAGAAKEAVSAPVSDGSADKTGTVSRYEGLLKQIDQDAVRLLQHSQALTPTAMRDRRKATEESERRLANEFTERFPVLYKASHIHHADQSPLGDRGKKAEAEGDFALQVVMVPHLERGLRKMQIASAATATTTSSSPSSLSGAALLAKLAGIESTSDGGGVDTPRSDRSPSYEFVKVTHSGAEDDEGEVGHRGTPAGDNVGSAGSGAPKKKSSKWRRILARAS